MRRHALTLALLFAAPAADLCAQDPVAQGEAAPAADESAPAIPAEVMMLRLYDGSILWGGIEDHDAELLHFRRLDNGGLVRIPWSRLDPPQADELLERFGYVDHSSEEIMTEADRLILVDGTEIVGLITNRTENEIWVKTSNSTIPVPKLRLRSAATVVQVPALDVYTKEELYNQEVAGLVADDAQSHLELATFCERIFHFERAIAHVEAALGLDPDLDQEELGRVLDRLAVKQENQAQLEKLREIDHLRARGRFDDALAEIEVFGEMFPDSPYRDDAQRKKVLVEKARERALREQVVRSWHFWARKLVRRAAQDPDMTLEAAIGWIDQGLGDEIVTNVHEDLVKSVSETVTPDEVQAYWSEREGGRWQKASYGAGTWLLGDAAARAGLAEEVDATEATSERDKERKALEERIKRYMKNQEMSRRAKSSGTQGDEDDQQSFWEEWSSAGRAQWLLAYYAENSGDMELRDPPHFRNCPECGGTGVREIINTGSARTGSRGASSQLIPCPSCHRVAIWRRISYR
jgi:hypothetical protein